jgi:hypothetical protein
MNAPLRKDECCFRSGYADSRIMPRPQSRGRTVGRCAVCDRPIVGIIRGSPGRQARDREVCNASAQRRSHSRARVRVA